MATQKNLIDKFLNLKRIAVIGVSRTKNDFSRTLWQEFRSRGFDAVPVHPLQREVDGVTCYKRVQDITPQVDGALILAPKARTAELVRDCFIAGIKTIWLYGIRGEKDIDQSLLNYCHIHDINVVAGFCPFMFFEKAHFLHRFHTFGWKMIGLYPK